MSKGTLVVGMIIGILLGSLLFNGSTTPQATASTPTDVEVQMTESFYRALQEDSNSNTTKYYGTRNDKEYLRQIAVSGKYTVETNIKIIEQQRRTIELLESIAKK